MYHLLFGLPSQLGHHRAMSRVPCTVQEVLCFNKLVLFIKIQTVMYFIHTYRYNIRLYVNLNLPTHPTSPFLFGVHMFVLYICVSISRRGVCSTYQDFIWIIESTLQGCWKFTYVRLDEFCFIDNSCYFIKAFFSDLPILVTNLRHQLWSDFITEKKKTRRQNP